MTNIMPDQYRQVAIAHVDIALKADMIRQFFLGREAYRRTQYIVVVAGEDTALVRVDKMSEEPLFSPITNVEVMAGPEDCVFLRELDVDVGVPSHRDRRSRCRSTTPGEAARPGQADHRYQRGVAGHRTDPGRRRSGRSDRRGR